MLNHNYSSMLVGAALALTLWCQNSCTNPVFDDKPKGCPDHVTFDRTSLTLHEGRSGFISVRESMDGYCPILWGSKDYEIANLNNIYNAYDRKAEVMALRVGQTTVFATMGPDKSDTDTARCYVTVLPVSIHSMVLSPDTLVVPISYFLGPGGSISAKFLDSVGVALIRSEVTWTSSDSTIARIQWSSGSGSSVRGCHLGTVTITASCEGVSASVRARVVPGDLTSVFGSSAADVYSVGSNGAILHYDGSTWKLADTVPASLTAVWSSSPEDVYVAGGGSWASQNAFHYDGNSWATLTNVSGPFTGIWGSSSADVYLLTPLTSFYYNGLRIVNNVFHFDGSNWSLTSTRTTRPARAIWGSSSSSIYVAGDGGSIIHFNGVEWSPEVPETWGLYLRSICGSSDSDVYVVGYGTSAMPGTVLHSDGNVWSTVYESPDSLYGVWASIDGDVFAVGANGIILHGNAQQVWSLMAAPTTELLFSVWGSSNRDVFAVGSRGTILHYNGTSWSPMAVPWN